MICEISTSSSFGTLARYLEGGRAGKRVPYDERVEHAETLNMLAQPGQTGAIAREMRDRAARSKRCQKPVLHLILSFRDEDDPGTERRFKAGRRMLERLGLDGHQAYLVSHKNAKTRDLHIEINRVGIDGRAWSTSWDYAKVEAAADDVCREMGLRRIPRHWYSEETRKKAEKEGWKLPRPDRTGPTSAERRRQKETGKTPLSEKVREQVAPIFETSQTWTELQSRLREVGAQVMPKGRGGVVAPLDAENANDGQTVKLSTIGRDHSWGKLAKRFGSFESFQQEQEMLADKQRGQPVSLETLLASQRLERPPQTATEALISMQRQPFSQSDHERIRDLHQPERNQQRSKSKGRSR